MRLHLILGLGAWLGLVACSHAARVEPAHAVAVAPPKAAAASMAPPIAAARPVTDVYFGTSIVDPYRWMESGSAELDAWMKAQSEYTERSLGALSLRAQLQERVRSLANGGVEAMSAQRRGSSLYYLKQNPSEETYKLYVSELDGTKERLIVDPTQRNSGSDTYSIDYFEPSPDGSYIAYGLSANGSEMAVIHVVETRTGRELPETIDRARYAFPSWQPDGRSFFYKRDRLLAADAPESERFVKAPVYLHKLETAPEQDVAVFGYGLSPQIDVPASGFSYVAAPEGASYLLAQVSDGVKHEIALYAVPREQLAGPNTPWRKIFGDDAGVTDAYAFRDTLYLVSHNDAPRRKVLRLTLTKRGPNDLSRAELLLPESEAVVRYLTVGKDGVYVQLLDAGLSRIQRIEHGTNKASEVALPVAGTVRDVSATDSIPGITFQLSSWTLAPRLYRFDPATNKVLDTGVIPASPVDFSRVTAREVKVSAPDGTSVPLSIIARNDLAADKPHPTLLHAYGAYGNVAEPSFDPQRLAWLERGGVFAVCHPRGGGEFGEAWHDAGKLGTKQNTINDVLACADYLVKKRLTSPAQLGLRGVSAGGIPASNGLTRQPAHFGAVVIRVGMVNALRFEQIPIGPFNTSEFGTVQTEEGFRMLLAIDAIQQVHDQTAYPAVLLATGIVDPRVSPWQASKLTARLQAATSSGKPVLLRIDYGAGHGDGTTKTKEADEIADEYAFLFWQLGAAAAQ